MKKTITITVLIIALAMLIIGGCQIQVPPQPSNTGVGTNYNPDLNIKESSFKSESEYVSFIKSNIGNNMFYKTGRSLGVADAFTLEATSLVQDTSTPDFSGTNNQVQGVDEGDILKTDGNYIYTITQQTLFIVKAYPGEDAEVVSTIKLEDMPRGLFIEGNKLAVFGDLSNVDSFMKEGIRIQNGAMFLNIYDISDKSEPELVKEYKFEGRYSNSRMIGNNMYLVSNVYPQYRIDYPTPIIMEDGIVEKMPVRDIHYFNIPYSNPSFIGIHSINILSGEKTDSEMLTVEGSPNLYMSKNNMYITYTERINEWDLQTEILRDLINPKLPDFYKAIITKIENTDIDVLSKYEKQAKIQQIYSEYMQGLSMEEQDNLNDESEKLLIERLEKFKYFEFTVINKVSVDNGRISVDTNGKAPGSILNQFSMDEYDNVFRIGTTLSARWSRFGDRTDSTNNIYTFDEDLNMLGSLEGLADGERIFSTRFIGDKLYMVTFRQVDPFFVIDLSDASNPKSLGELKIPGFSRYLHPYDENHIIGIGRDASETGRQEGLKISLFDVTDVENPKEVAKYVADSKYSSTSAEWEHKAFLFSKEKNLLVIPAVSNRGYGWDNNYEGDEYNGALVFNIDENDIELRGLIDHSSGNYNYWQPAVERSLYINELLYTKSPSLLRINELDDLSSVKEITLKASNNVPIIIY